jgi:hypothetical protein
MGLDWRPLGRPKPGFEERYNQVFRIIQGLERQELSLIDKLIGKKKETTDQLLQEWYSISIPSYEAIRAPRVGRDKAADDWVLKEYEETDKSKSISDFIKEHDGYYVIELSEELDGVPMYIAMGQDRNVFRGQFLKDCVDLVGEKLLNEAWETKLASETLKYGQQLLSVADKVAIENGLSYLREQRIPPDTDVESLESKVHILYSAAKWLIFYGTRGHGYEADF